LNQDQLTPLIEKYQRALEQNPRSLVFAPLAECYRKLGMLKEASLLLRDGMRNHPQYVLGHLGMAELAKDQGNYQLAYTLLKSFKDSHRDNFKLMKLYARSCFQLQHFEEALQTYKYILFLNPKDKDAAMMVEQLEDQPILDGDIDKSGVEKEYFKVNEIDSFATEENDWVEQSFATSTQGDEDESSKWKMQNIRELPEQQQPEPKLEFKDDADKDDVREFRIVDSVGEASSEVNDEQPFITHTLVDLYIGQGYLDKASELLEKIIELNPQDEKSAQKLSSIRDSMIEAGIVSKSAHENKRSHESEEENQSEEEGRSKLMRILDATLMDSKINEHLTRSDSAYREKLEQKLWGFHDRLREKAQRSQE
jgi:tetratricopeptide (TPR) repeat protein